MVASTSKNVDFCGACKWPVGEGDFGGWKEGHAGADVPPKLIWAVAVPAMRHVAHALLVGADANQRGADALPNGSSGSGAGQGFEGEPAAAALAYVRDRIGVPRDFPLPAARQLCAHFNLP